MHKLLMIGWTLRQMAIGGKEHQGQDGLEDHVAVDALMNQDLVY